MTSLIDNNIDELIRRLKEQKAVSDFVFMMAYPPRSTTNPVRRYTVAVNNEGVSQGERYLGDSTDSGRLRLYEATLSLRVYAPGGSAGAALLRATSLLMDALDTADTNRAVTAVSVGKIAYESAMHTIYRDIRVKLEYLLYREVEA